ncbi:meiosis expressed gene 1 protein homolog [Acropora palmata]|uniref:meiosis expressed gene 1 protein homolog n=1 Tax=Acropora palmata TaxID=6131 RepID=UPI003DA1009A
MATGNCCLAKEKQFSNSLFSRVDRLEVILRRDATENQRYIMASIQSVVSPVAQPTGPKSVSRPKRWSEEVEEAYRFQIAGYRDVHEYRDVKRKEPDRWPHNGYVKKLQRKDGYFIYFDRTRECTDKDVYKCKLYGY